MKPSRLRIQLGLPAAFAAMTLVCVALVINTLPGAPRMLGHVAIDELPYRPGLWISGRSYGWPWSYRTESFKTEAFAYDGFDRFDWSTLTANVGVALCCATAIAWLGERLLLAGIRWIRTSNAPTA